MRVRPHGRHRRRRIRPHRLLGIVGRRRWGNDRHLVRPRPLLTVTFPVTITDDDGQQVTIDAPPERIVTFAPSMTETVFALGLGDRLVGVSGAYDDYPAAAKRVQEIGGAGEFGVDPNIEKVVSLQPDLFLTISGGDQWKQELRDLGVPVVTLNATDLPDLLDDIRVVGDVTGATVSVRRVGHQHAGTGGRGHGRGGSSGWFGLVLLRGVLPAAHDRRSRDVHL